MVSEVMLEPFFDVYDTASLRNSTRAKSIQILTDPSPFLTAPIPKSP